MLKAKIVLISALVSCALVSGCKDDKKSSVAIEFMHSSVEQERQAVIAKLIERFEKENPGIGGPGKRTGAIGAANSGAKPDRNRTGGSST